MVLDRLGQPRWSPLWEGNPRILKPGRIAGDYQTMVNGPRCRPYIDYPRMKAEFERIYPGVKFKGKSIHPDLPWRFSSHKCTAGEFYCLADSKHRGHVVIEPHTKARASPNREWGWARWQAVVDALPDLDWVQINPPGASVLEGVRHVPADKFLKACRRLNGAGLYVGPEGGLYHAATALGIPAVAIFGGFVSPANQGYDHQVNLYEPDGSPCGMRVKCGHCTRALARITPEAVIEHVTRMLLANGN